VSTLATTLPTAGGGLVDVLGERLGLIPATITLAYSGGSPGLPQRTFQLPPGACTVVTPGAHLRCPTLPGAGSSYTFTVTVDGGASAPSVGTLSYSAPVLTAVEGPGAVQGPARGGAPITFRGVNFGPAGPGTEVQAWASPAAAPHLQFPATDCMVVEVRRAAPPRALGG
jgi:hypothetical protein